MSVAMLKYQLAKSSEKYDVTNIDDEKFKNGNLESILQNFFFFFFSSALSWVILLAIIFFCMYQKCKLTNKKRRNSLLAKKKSLVGLTPGVDFTSVFRVKIPTTQKDSQVFCVSISLAFWFKSQMRQIP